MDKAAGTSYLVSGAATLFGGMTANELVALAGIAGTIGTFIVNLIFKYLHYRLEKERKDGCG